MAPYVPLRKELELTAQQRRVVRGQHTRAARALPADQRIERIREQSIRIRFVERGEIRTRAKIREQEKTSLEILCEDLRDMQPGIAHERRDLHERPAVFLFRRRIHDNPCTIVRTDAEIAPEARILGCGLEHELAFVK